MPYAVRRPALDDAPGLARVHVRSWREAYAGIVPQAHLDALSEPRREAFWRGVLASDQARVWVAEQEGEVVAFSSSGPARDASLRGWGELYALYALRAHHGQGLGRRLVAASAKDLLDRDLRRMILWVLRDNPTRGFYERLGGSPLADRDERIGGATLREVALGWDDVASLLA